MLASLAFSLVAAVCIGTGLCVAGGFSSRNWAEARSESAILLADAGINSELALLAASGDPTPSSPTAAPDETMTYPGESHPVYGRKGSLDGTPGGTYWVCTSANEWWRSGATPVAWDGISPSLWITSSAYVQGSWRRASVKVAKQSVFGRFAMYATDSAGPNDDIVAVDPTAVATVTGLAGTNGKVNLNGASGLSLGNALNSNTALAAGPQFSPGSVRSGSTLSNVAAPTSFARTASTMQRLFNLVGTPDVTAWAWLLLNSNNATGVYTYKPLVATATLSRANCLPVLLPNTQLRNWGLLPLSKGWWDLCNVKPGTSGKVKTLIFEPGDYYFTDVMLKYDPSTELVVDPLALASGGTPGPVRFWFYDAPLLGGADNIDLPLVMTKPSGAATPDSSQFRILYGKDGFSLTLNRPANIKDYNGNSLAGDFNLYGSIYSVTDSPNTTGLIDGLLMYGTKVILAGSSWVGGRKVVLNGSLIADRIGFKGPSAVTFVSNASAGDPGNGARIVGEYRDGK